MCSGVGDLSIQGFRRCIYICLHRQRKLILWVGPTDNPSNIACSSCKMQSPDHTAEFKLGTTKPPAGPTWCMNVVHSGRGRFTARSIPLATGDTCQTVMRASLNALHPRRTAWSQLLVDTVSSLLAQRVVDVVTFHHVRKTLRVSSAYHVVSH